MDLIDVKDSVQCALTADINASQTKLPVGPGAQDFLPAGGHYTMAVLRNAEDSEAVKVTAAAFGSLTVDRGQDGSTPKAFKAGALVSMRLVKSSFAQFEQKGVMRQVAYNHNGVLAPAYFGEQVAETGVDGCTHRIWQNVLSGKSSWRIVYGNICPNFSGYRDWNWETIDIWWENWPSVEPRPVSDCGFSPEDMAYISDSSRLLGCLICSQSLFSMYEAGDVVTFAIDQSGSENNFYPVDDLSPILGDTYLSFEDSGANIGNDLITGFVDDEWTWFFSFKLSTLSGAVSISSFSASATFSCKESGTEYAIHSSSAESGGTITGDSANFTNPTVITVRASLQDYGGYLNQYTNFRVNGVSIGTLGTWPYDSESRAARFSSFDSVYSGNGVANSGVVVGFKRRLTDEECATIESILIGGLT